MKKRYLFAPAVLAMFAAGSAHATLVSFMNQDIPIPTDFPGVSVNLETGASAAGDLVNGDMNVFFGGANISNDAWAAQTVATFQPVRVGTGNGDTVVNMTPGTTAANVVGPSSTFSSGFGVSSNHLGSQFTDGQEGYIGFSLDSGSNTFFGWMRVTLTANTAGGFIHEWAYEDSGLGVYVGGGAVPEASQISILALGALGIAFHRRRRRK